MVLCALALLGAVIAEVAAGAEPRKLSAIFFLLAWAPLLVLHECGHALAAWCVGFRIERLVLGFGARRAAFRVLGVPVELRTLPVTGFVSTRSADGRGARLAHAFVYAAGPGIELALVALLGAVLGFERLVTPSDDMLVLALQSVAAAAATGAITNLIPGSTGSDRGAVPTDGLGIVLALFGPRARR